MPVLCPNCREPIDLTALVCPGGHRFACQDGVLMLLEAEFGRRLKAFTARLNVIRAAERKRLMDVSAYEGLPFSQLDCDDAGGRLEWRLRGYDLEIVLRRLGRRRQQRILDVGAWNGWLSHRLAAQGHDVTAVDYFVDEYDGLGARKFYSTNWRAIQMDLTDLSVLPSGYDVIVLNRCLQFFTDPIAYVAGVKQLLSPGGMLIITGLQFFQDASVKAPNVAAQRRSVRERYGFELFLKPTKGYLDFDDKQRLQAQRVTLKPYPQLWLTNIKSIFNRTLPRHMYGYVVAGWAPTPSIGGRGAA